MMTSHMSSRTSVRDEGRLRRRADNQILDICGSPVLKLKVIPLRISITLLCLKCRIAELSLRAGLIRAL